VRFELVLGVCRQLPKGHPQALAEEAKRLNYGLLKTTFWKHKSPSSACFHPCQWN